MMYVGTRDGPRIERPLKDDQLYCDQKDDVTI